MLVGNIQGGFHSSLLLQKGHDNMTNVQQALSSCWEKLSLDERRKFLTFESSQLCIALCDARDKSIELFHKNLVTIPDFADTMCWELEHRERKDKLQQSFTALHEEINKDGFTSQVAQHLEALSQDVKQFLIEDPTDEELDKDDENAYSNIMSVMKAEEAKTEAMLSA